MRHLSIAACAAVLSVAFLIPLASSLALRFTVASSVPPAPTSAAPRGIRAIDHMVFIIKENHSFDNDFGRFPGAAGATAGWASAGAVVPLTQAPDQVYPDLAHSADVAFAAYNGGRMNRFDRITGAVTLGVNHAYAQMLPQDIPNCWAYSRHFTLADHFLRRSWDRPSRTTRSPSRRSTTMSSPIRPSRAGAGAATARPPPMR